MQPSDVREAIILKALSVTLTTKAGAGDKFAVIRVPQEPEQASERALMVKLLSCGRDASTTCARFATYQVVGFYNASPDIDDRQADDSLKLDDALWTLPAGDITSVEVSDTTIGDDLRTRRDVRVVYLHDD